MSHLMCPGCRGRSVETFRYFRSREIFIFLPKYMSKKFSAAYGTTVRSFFHAKRQQMLCFYCYRMVPLVLPRLVDISFSCSCPETSCIRVLLLAECTIAGGDTTPTPSPPVTFPQPSPEPAPTCVDLDETCNVDADCCDPYDCSTIAGERGEMFITREYLFCILVPRHNAVPESNHRDQYL